MFEMSDEEYKKSSNMGESAFTSESSTDIVVDDPNNDTFNKWIEDLNSINSITSYISDKASPIFKDGTTAAKAAESALHIIYSFKIFKKENGDPLDPPKNGYYWINLPVVGPKFIYCIMDEKFYGGGWMLAIRAVKTSKTFRYRSEHWTNNTTLKSSYEDIKGTFNVKIDGYDNIKKDLDISSIGDYIFSDASDRFDAKFDTFNYYPATEWMSVFYNRDPSKTIYDKTNIGNEKYCGGDSLTNNAKNTRGWIWREHNINHNGNAVSPLQLYQKLGGSNKSLTTVDPTSLDKFKNNPNVFQLWSSQNGNKFYGLNYNYTSWWDWRGSAVRWGFTWNNEGNWESNDVHGGIGVDYDTNQGGHRNSNNGWSCGDFIWCCQHYTGVNRTIPFEWFVR